jgi:hypothetical protein
LYSCGISLRKCLVFPFLKCAAITHACKPNIGQRSKAAGRTAAIIRMHDQKFEHLATDVSLHPI